MSEANSNDNNKLFGAIYYNLEHKKNSIENQSDKVKRLEGSLGSFDGQWNFENWIRLLDCLAASSTASEEYIRVTFERTLAVFPNAYGVWIKYVTWETLLPDSSRSVGRIEELFSRCLKSVLHPELFRFYLEYMKKVNKSGTDFTAEGRTAVMKAYEFTLNSIGLDMDSSDIWLDYLNFLRKWQCSNAGEVGMRLDLMRKIFHSAIRVPMAGIESIWKEYDAFENGFKNKAVAKKLFSEKSPIYMSSRMLWREGRGNVEAFRKGLTLKSSDGIVNLGDPDLAFNPLRSSEMQARLEAWKKWLQWERSNPLKMEETDAMLHNRIMHVFKQGIIYLRHSSHVWFEFLSFLSERQDDDADNLDHFQMLALTALPLSPCLHFCIAERYEVGKQLSQIKHVFERFLGFLENLCEILADGGDMTASLDSFQETFGIVLPLAMDNDASPLSLERVRNTLNLTYIQYIKVMRRFEGIKAARSLFSRFRKSPLCSYHVYLYSSQMEFFCSKDVTVAQKILEVGLKQFPNSPAFYEHYLKFLININDDHNRRTLFEKAISVLDPANCQAIWELFVSYENMFGDFATIKKLQERGFDQLPALESYSKRQSFLDLSCDGFNKKESSLAIVPVEHPYKSALKSKATTVKPSSSSESNVLISVNRRLFPRPDFSQLSKLDTIKGDGDYESGSSNLTSKRFGSTPLPHAPMSQLVNQFLVQLPSAESFDGPSFDVDKVIHVLRNEVSFPSTYYDEPTRKRFKKSD